MVDPVIRVGINGFGRIGRLVFRLLYNQPGIDIVQINEAVADAEMSAYLVNFDSVHGRWEHRAVAETEDYFVIDGQHRIPFSKITNIQDTPGWTKQQPYFDAGVRKVVVACPVKEEGVLNVVMGCNDHLLKEREYPIVTAASCTTNCIAPVIKVLEEKLGIDHGCITTIHNLTNTQAVVDAPNTKKSDLRRARSALMNLAPTSTGSAAAIAEIFPQLKGKLNGLAIRVPLTNASITDLVMEVKRNTTVEEVNALLKEASENELEGILGYEEQPLVSTDYLNDPRSTIVDAKSTMVIQGRMVKIYAWYDNEFGYAKRMSELAVVVSKQLIV